MASTHIDDTQLQTLAAEGLSQSEIAKQLSIPRSTVRDHLKKLDSASPHLSPAPHPVYDLDPKSTQSPHNIHIDMIMNMTEDLQELVTWWQDRKASLHQASDASRKTERTTFHVEQRWINAIRRQADLDNLTYTQIINEAFRQYFEEK